MAFSNMNQIVDSQQINCRIPFASIFFFSYIYHEIQYWSLASN